MTLKHAHFLVELKKKEQLTFTQDIEQFICHKQLLEILVKNKKLQQTLTKKSNNKLNVYLKRWGWLVLTDICKQKNQNY